MGRSIELHFNRELLIPRDFSCKISNGAKYQRVRGGNVGGQGAGDRGEEAVGGREGEDHFAKENSLFWEKSSVALAREPGEKKGKNDREGEREREEIADQSYYKNPQNNRRGSH